MARHESERLLGPSRIFMEPDDSTAPIAGRDLSLEKFRGLNDQDRLELRLTRRFLLETFGVKNLSEISDIGKELGMKDGLRQSFINKYCSMLGVEGSYDKKLTLVESGLNGANNVMSIIEDPQTGLLRQLRGNIGTINEVAIVNDPLDLLLMTFSDRASKRMRYEARRKLLLGDLTVRVNVQQMDIVKNLDGFSRFLGRNIWSSDTSAKVKPIELLSYHSPDNYACTKVQILDSNELTNVSEFIQYHRFGMRSWKDINATERLVMVEHRGKSDAAQVIKLLRKDTKNIGTIDDSVGFKMTFLTKRDIYSFLEKLQHEANKNGTALMCEEIYDTIDNGSDFRITNPGSSKKLEIIKTHLRYNGALIELQLHTLRSFIDSRLHDEYGFEEYALSRLFERGRYEESVIDLLYPPDIYGSDISLYYEELKADIRENKRIRSHFLPKEHSKNEMRRIRYSDSDLVTDSGIILDQLVDIPDYIVALGRSGLPLARELALHLQGTRLIIFDPQNEQLLAHRSESLGNVLIVDDIGDQCKTILDAKQKFPTAKVAVLGKRNNEISQTEVDYFARIVNDHEFLVFAWDRGINEQESQTFAVGIIWRRIEPNNVEILFGKTTDERLKLPGGRVEKGDKNIETGFLRELQEETGITGKKPYPLTDSTYKSKRNHIFPRSYIRFYELEIDHLPIQNDNNDPEIVGLVWIKMDQALQKLATPEFQKPFAHALNILKQRL